MKVTTNDEVHVGPGRIAPDAIGAVGDLYYRLLIALSNAVVTGDYALVEHLISIIESWRSGNEEERKAYKIFTSNNPYKKLYKRAKELLKQHKSA